MWDPRRARYVLYGRTQHRAPETVAAWSPNDWYRAGNPRLWHWGRSVARAESPDFVRWDYTAPASAPVVLTADARDPACTEFYSVMVFPYESVYIGLLQNFRSSPDTCWIDIQLVVSRDTASFTRVGDRAPFLPLGGLGEWDRFNHSLANNPPLAVGDDLRFYYSGRRGRHDPYGTLKDYAQPDVGVSDGSIGFASVRRDRFVSLGASFDGGELVTRPLDVRGSALFLNGKADHGEILVEALDPSGAVLARAHPWRADSLSRAVAWPSGGLPGAGAPMRFRITLRNALLYALWAE